MSRTFFSTPHRLLWRHRKGANVAYAYGSAKWADVGLFKSITGENNDKARYGNEELPVIDWNGLDQSFTADANGTIAKAWYLLDEQ